MNNAVKASLTVAIIIGIFVFAVAALRYVDSYSKSIQPSSFRSFSATGEGKVTAIPDLAQFTFTVITQGGIDIARLHKENVEKTNRAIAFVKSKGVEEKDIKTQTFQLEPRYQYFSCPEKGGSCPPPEIVGYTITQTVLLKIRDFAKIGDVFSGVIENGANSVSQLSFTIDDPEKIQSEARTQAIQKAKEKAKSIAKAGGFRIGRLLSIQEGGYYPPPFYEYARGADVAPSISKTLPAPTIEPGSQEVAINVTLVHEIE